MPKKFKTKSTDRIEEKKVISHKKTKILLSNSVKNGKIKKNHIKNVQTTCMRSKAVRGLTFAELRYADRSVVDLIFAGSNIQAGLTTDAH